MEDLVVFYKKQGAPIDQTALVALLKEIQQANGGHIPLYLLAEVAERLNTKESFLQAVIRRIPSLRLGDASVVELCAGPNCGKHTQLAKAAEDLCKRAGATLKFAPCMRMCGKGPNLKYNGRLYHGADEALLRRLLKQEERS